MDMPSEITLSDLFAEIDGYIAKIPGMTERKFGEAAMGDHKFVPDVRAGRRDCRQTTRAKVLKYIALNPPAETSEAAA
jgi:hypothetical protein